MATESIFHNVVLKKSGEVQAFVNAIEKSKTMAKLHADINKPKTARMLNKAETKKLLMSGKKWAGFNS